MTLSKEDRVGDINRALRLMMVELGDQAYFSEFFSSTSPVFKEIYPTTWVELLSRGLIQRLKIKPDEYFQLTGQGWIARLKLTREIEMPAFISKMSQLSAALKNRVKGRHNPALCTPADVSREPGLVEEWIINAIDSQLLDLQFNIQGARRASSLRSQMIWIPINFGQEHL